MRLMIKKNGAKYHRKTRIFWMTKGDCGEIMLRIFPIFHAPYSQQATRISKVIIQNIDGAIPWSIKVKTFLPKRKDM